MTCPFACLKNNFKKHLPPEPATPKVLREFGLIAGVLIALLWGLYHPWHGHTAMPLWPWITGVILVVVSLLMPAVIRPFFWVATMFSAVMGMFMTPIVLGIMYYGMVVPMGVLMRLFAKDPMRRTIDPGATTYRVPSEKLPPSRMEMPY